VDRRRAPPPPRAVVGGLQRSRGSCGRPRSAARRARARAIEVMAPRRRTRVENRCGRSATPLRATRYSLQLNRDLTLATRGRPRARRRTERHPDCPGPPCTSAGRVDADPIARSRTSRGTGSDRRARAIVAIRRPHTAPRRRRTPHRHTLTRFAARRRHGERRLIACRSRSQHAVSG
jgi:hypothetical protein